MAAQKTARASPELRKGSTQPALPSDLYHHPGHKPVSHDSIADNDFFAGCTGIEMSIYPRWQTSLFGACVALAIIVQAALLHY